ncbi:MAG: hypothetical protein E6Q97_20430 [Desulfurellales bacterium]|nr:MAG: hypothetical protein E6Q97_20430 [Desulfurellales bacterium]
MKQFPWTVLCVGLSSSSPRFSVWKSIFGNDPIPLNRKHWRVDNELVYFDEGGHVPAVIVDVEQLDATVFDKLITWRSGQNRLSHADTRSALLWGGFALREADIVRLQFDFSKMPPS